MNRSCFTGVRNTRTAWRSIAALALLVVAPSLAASQAITFSQTGIGGSGKIGAVSFLNRDFRINATGNVADRQSFSGGYFIDHLSASIFIVGLGTYDFITATRTFVNNDAQVVGFSRAGSGGADLYDSEPNPAFATWDMGSSLTTVAVNTQIVQWSGVDVNTSGGVLKFDELNTRGSISAVVGPSTTVPEPSTYAMMSSGLVALVVFARRRRRA